jgi:hypothetical protein
LPCNLYKQQLRILNFISNYQSLFIY